MLAKHNTIFVLIALVFAAIAAMFSFLNFQVLNVTVKEEVKHVEVSPSPTATSSATPASATSAGAVKKILPVAPKSEPTPQGAEVE